MEVLFLQTSPNLESADKIRNVDLMPIIWAYSIRKPYRMGVSQSTGRYFLCDYITDHRQILPIKSVYLRHFLNRLLIQVALFFCDASGFLGIFQTPLIMWRLICTRRFPILKIVISLEFYGSYQGDGSSFGCYTVWIRRYLIIGSVIYRWNSLFFQISAAFAICAIGWHLYSGNQSGFRTHDC